MHLAGRLPYNLASALEPTRRNSSTNQRLTEWQKKFSAPDGPPRGIRSYTVVSPVHEKEAEKYSDDEWLHAIAKYNEERGVPDWNNPEKGGASQFAGLLQNILKKEPERFARLSLRLPAGTNSSYWMNILYGLHETQVASALKCKVARRVFDSDSNACLMAALDVLAAIVDIQLPDDAVLFIKRMATEHPDPIPEPKEADTSGKKADIRIDGRNSVRGHAAVAIQNLVYHNKNYLAVFEKTIEHLVNDPSLAVRACAAFTLMGVAYHDTPRAIVLFKKLVEEDDCLFATDYVQRFIAAGLNNHLPDFLPSIKRMLASLDKEVCQAGGTYSCLARLYHTEADDLAEAALAGNVSCRLGVVTVAKDNFLNPNCRVWCEAKLKLLFFDKEAEIRKTAANCFWYLWHQPDMPLDQFTSLIQTFLCSPAFAEEPTFLLHTLDDTRQRVPEVILDICEHFVSKCAEQARDIRTALAADEYTVGKLVFRAYAQLEAAEPRRRTLNLIDRICEEGLQSTGQYFAEFER